MQSILGNFCAPLTFFFAMLAFCRFIGLVFRCFHILARSNFYDARLFGVAPAG